MTAQELVGLRFADIIAPGILRGELAEMYPELGDQIAQADTEALRRLAAELTGAAVITSASYSPKRRTYQVTLGKPLGITKHLHVSYLTAEDR